MAESSQKSATSLLQTLAALSPSALSGKMPRTKGAMLETCQSGQLVSPEGPSPDNPFAGRPYAGETQRAVDTEVPRLLREAAVRATAVLRAYLSTLGHVVELLLERETVDGSDLAGGRSSRRRRAWGPPVRSLP